MHQIRDVPASIVLEIFLCSGREEESHHNKYICKYVSNVADLEIKKTILHSFSQL